MTAMCSSLAVSAFSLLGNEIHAQFGGNKPHGSAHLCSISCEHHLTILRLLILRQVLNDGTKIANLLGGMVVIGHGVNYRDAAGRYQFNHAPGFRHL